MKPTQLDGWLNPTERALPPLWRHEVEVFALHLTGQYLNQKAVLQPKFNDMKAATTIAKTRGPTFAFGQRKNVLLRQE